MTGKSLNEAWVEHARAKNFPWTDWDGLTPDQRQAYEAVARKLREAQAPTCQTCRHWSELVPQDGRGQCRRKAPAPALFARLPHSLGGDGLRARWPLTLASEDCGEHEPADAGDLASKLLARADRHGQLARQQTGVEAACNLAAEAALVAAAQEL